MPSDFMSRPRPKRVGAYKWRAAMRDDYDHLQSVWNGAYQGVSITQEAREAALGHYETGYEHAMLITTRLCDALRTLFENASTAQRGNKWIGEVVTAWIHQDPHSLENEQLSAYNALVRAETESEWMRPVS